MMPFRWIIPVLLLLVGCRKESPRPAPGVQAYVWQDCGRPEVQRALTDSSGVITTLHLRAAELRWTGRNFKVERVITDRLPAPACGLVIRIGASAARLEWTAAEIGEVAKVVGELAELKPTEIQCDYDCPQSRLDRYIVLLEALQKAAGPVPVIPTTLPSWLDSPEFAKLVAGRPGYVLQVHSLHLPKTPEEPVLLFDPAATRLAVKRASSLGVPFRVAMATYGCEVWFGPDGKVMEVISEDRAPEGKIPTRRSFSLADPIESARLIHEWDQNPPTGLGAVIWYRLPVEGDRRNWPWQTFQLVAKGEERPASVILEDALNDQVSDLSLANPGEFPAPLPAHIVVTSPVEAADAIGGYRVERRGDGLHFIRRADVWPWLDPGKKIPIGWLRSAGKTSRIAWHFSP
jgi:hypothetical protein